MATIIQSTNLITAADPAVTLSAGGSDMYYELAGITVATTGSTAISSGDGNVAYIDGSVFGASRGILANGALNVFVGRTGSVTGGFSGIADFATGSIFYCMVDG